MVRPQEGFDVASALAGTQGLVTGMENQKLEFLLIQRRDSLGFIELMRGRYKSTDIDYIRLHMNGITADERRRYCEGPFEELWNSMWGLDHSHLYKNEYETAKAKWEQIHRGYDVAGKTWSAKIIADSCEPAFDTPEWGFPKGRRDGNETDLECALREMREETGLSETDVEIVHNLEALNETFFGSNQVHYCHKYYLAVCDTRFDVSMNYANPHMNREIGNIQWLPLDAALSKIRPDSVEKREILLKVGRILRNFCPVPIYDSKKS
jgi:8-oxo-dGTP pyrophosphatase MutT (NUDIX family)